MNYLECEPYKIDNGTWELPPPGKSDPELGNFQGQYLKYLIAELAQVSGMTIVDRLTNRFKPSRLALEAPLTPGYLVNHPPPFDTAENIT